MLENALRLANRKDGGHLSLIYREFFKSAANGVLEISFVYVAVLGTAIRLTDQSGDKKTMIALSRDEPWILEPDMKIIRGEASWEEKAHAEIAQLFLAGKGDLLKLTRICPTCGRIFLGETSKAKFCRDACRAKWHRDQN